MFQLTPGYFYQFHSTFTIILLWIIITTNKLKMNIISYGCIQIIRNKIIFNTITYLCNISTFTLNIYIMNSCIIIIFKILNVYVLSSNVLPYCAVFTAILTGTPSDVLIIGLFFNLSLSSDVKFKGFHLLKYYNVILKHNYLNFHLVVSKSIQYVLYYFDQYRR